MTRQSIIPQHLGLILDGNRRWAKANNLPPLEGHRRGYENLKVIGKAAVERGVTYLSAYVFSTENWDRSQEEVKYLMKLLTWFANREVNELHEAGIRVRFIGSRDRLDKSVLAAINNAEHKTRANKKGTLVLCLNYGGQQEITAAVQAIVAQNIPSKDINSELITANIYAPDIPPVDLIIRTSGEQRLSNFMLWRAAYSELYFTKKSWPAFNQEDLDLALADFAKRQRRFGT